MKSFRNFVPSWRDIRPIGNSLPAKISVAAPILGHLIVLNQFVFDTLRAGLPPLATLLPPDQDFSRVISIYFLYMGLFVFGLGSIIFQLFSDRLIKENSSEDRFVKANLGQLTQSDLLLFLQEIEDAPHVSEKEKELAGVSSARIKIEQLSAEETLNDSSTIQVCKLYYRMIATRKLVARFFTFVLMALGLLLLAIPSFITFYKVVFTLL